MAKERPRSRSGPKFREKPSDKRERLKESRRKELKSLLVVSAVISIIVIIVYLLLTVLPQSSEDEPYTPLCLEFDQPDKREDEAGWWTKFNVTYDRSCYDEMTAHGQAVNLTFQYEFIDGSESTILSMTIPLNVPPGEGIAFVTTPQLHFSKEPVSFKMLDMRCE